MDITDSQKAQCILVIVTVPLVLIAIGLVILSVMRYMKKPEKVIEWLRTFYIWLGALAILGGTWAFFLPIALNSGFNKDDDGPVLRQLLIYTVGGILGVITLGETHRKNNLEKDKNDQDHTRQVHAERRSRYTKAIEHLFNENISIRLGGVYTLTGLADEWLSDEKTLRIEKERRKETQNIINNLCAYIRSPFDLASKTEVLSQDQTPENYEGGAQQFVKDQTKFREEKELRITILESIKNRLSGNTISQEYSIIKELKKGSWSNFDYDFSNAHFFYPVGFNNSYFGSSSKFSGAKFAEYANFSGAKFAEYVNFPEAEFTLGADFSEAEFTLSANFSEAEFTGDATFSGAKFARMKFTGMKSTRMKSTRGADFSGAKFTGNATFSKAEFTERTKFSRAKFTGNATFSKAEFTRGADFSGGKFAGSANFSEAEFTLGADFSEAEFTESTKFSWAKFTANADFFETVFPLEVKFSRAKFLLDVNFSEAEFPEYANFPEAEFTGDATFSGAKFTGDATFSGAKFTRNADFFEAAFEDKPRFEYTLDNKTCKARFSCKANPEDYNFKVWHYSPYKIETEEQEHNGTKFIIPKGTELFDPDEPSEQSNNDGN